MALILKDRVKEQSTSTGTTSFTLSGAYTGYQTFNAVIASGSTVYYCIHNTTAGVDGEWEVGVGTFTATSTLSRDTVLESSNSGSLVSFSAGTKEVFITYPAEKSVILDSSGNTTALGTVSSGTWQGTAVAANYGGTGQTSLTANNVILGNGTSAVQFVAPGANGNVLTSNGTTWTSAAAGGGTNITTKGLWENAITISANYSVTNGNNAMSAGPITIASGVTVTIPTGSRWVIM